MVNKKIVSRGFSRKLVVVLVSIILFLLLISAGLLYQAQNDSGLYFKAFFIFLLAISIYFFTLFHDIIEDVDIDKSTICRHYLYSFKKDKVIPLTEILGYYIYADGGLRRIVLVLKDKSELKFSDTFDSFFKDFQEYIFKNYQMISHKNHKVYSQKRKEHELHVYRTLPPIIAKANYEHETFELHSLWMAGIFGLLYFTYYLGSILNVINLICFTMIVISYFLIKSRKAKLNSSKEFNDE